MDDEPVLISVKDAGQNVGLPPVPIEEIPLVDVHGQKRTHDESPRTRGTPADARLGFLKVVSIGQRVELRTP